MKPTSCRFFLAAFLSVASGLCAGSCGTGSGEISLIPDAGADRARAEDTEPEAAVPALDIAAETDAAPEVTFDAGPDTAEPACTPGTGCFGDHCDGNGQCQSGWCLEHMGEGVCSQQCVEECPAGWSCKPVGVGPDLVSVCVSGFGNLCKPCAGGPDCKGTGGQDDVCVDYGTEGSFCGGTCTATAECPWGFACKKALTVDGLESMQCVAEAGVCPCTAKSAALSLWTPCERVNEWGTCQGKRACTSQGLSECDAAQPAAEACNGLDDNCDGQTDEPALHEGAFLNLCDDANDCTQDSCLGADGCSHEGLTGGECKDGDPCTAGDHCDAGVCKGLPVVCDDGDPCTDDSCDGLGGCTVAFNLAACDDGDPCTVADTCAAGECTGYAVDCECMTDADCVPLDDGNACNGTLSCDTAKLPHLCKVAEGTVVSCPKPAGPDAACLQSDCDPLTGNCDLLPANEGAWCDDSEVCTAGDHCQGGKCVPGATVNCKDGNPCTDDACVAGIGCNNVPNALACNDGDACTLADTCAGGKCVGGPAPDCDDLNPCTDDSCDPVKGCVHAANKADCTDGNACTQGDHCSMGQCVFLEIVTCNDGDPCTTDSCQPVAGCVFSLNDAACDDGDWCTVGDHCQLGVCIGGGKIACNDGNPCTDDACSPLVGCTFAPNAKTCDDGNACTTGDACSQGACKAASLLQCDDANPCTDDSCLPATGCAHTPNAAACSDANACTVGDTCAAGLCAAGGPLDCDDANPCTDDACLPQSGCSHKANTSLCSDGNACTKDDKCVAGSCIPGAPVACDDGLWCNGPETCDPATGCTLGTPPTLDDGLKCTVDSCDEQADKAVHVPDSAQCNNGKWCDGPESCDPVVGCMAGLPPVLSDAVACTVDTCDEANDQPVHTPDNAACDDTDKCTVDSCDAALGCKHEFSTQLCSYFDVGNGKILLANGIYIKCFGGLTVSPTQVSCKFPLFNTESYSTDSSKNIMLGLHNSGETWAAGHAYIQGQIGAYVGYSGGRQVQMNEPGPGNMWSGTGTHQNEHCYAQGQLLNWQTNAVCNGGWTGGSNVLSSFVLTK
jgi:hypothetical protein